jgi:hypothetical protein
MYAHTGLLAAADDNDVCVDCVCVCVYDVGVNSEKAKVIPVWWNNTVAM